VTQRDFAAGHSVARSQPLNLDANTRQQLTQAPILPHPLVTPAATIAAPQATAKALPPSAERPVLTTVPTTHGPAPIVRNANRPAMTQPLGETPAPSYPQPRATAAPAQPEAAPARPPDQPRALINRTPPQPPQPKFEEQQREIERNDPGRPLGPQQVENLRNGRPAGASPQPEPVAHPAPPPPPPKPAPKPK